jgi:transcriptional regulator with XRE-family HTH domain
MLTAAEILDKLIGIKELNSDSALAKELGVKQNTVSTWRKRNSIPYDLIFEMCRKENIPLDRLFGDDPTERVRQEFSFIGRNLKELRGRTPIEKVSVDTGISVELLIMFESGEAAPGGEAYQKLCEYFDVASLFVSADRVLKDHQRGPKKMPLKGEIERSPAMGERVKKKRSYSPLVKAITELLIALPEEGIEDVLDVMTAEIFRRGLSKKGGTIGEFLREKNQGRGKK